MPSKTKDKKAKQFTCTIKGKKVQNRWEVSQKKFKRNTLRIVRDQEMLNQRNSKMKVL